MKVAVFVGIIFLALAILFIISPALVSAKSTSAVFVGFALAAFAIASLVYVGINLLKGNK